MDTLRERLKELKARFDALSLKIRIASLAGVGVLLAVAILVYVRGSDPTHAILFSNLAQPDAARIVERLRALNVPYELVDGGATITVPEAQVHETRLTLANEGLPSGGGVGFEIFDTTRFGESDFSEQVQFRRALEGELSRTLSHIGGVTAARVHLVLPERTLFADDRASASASVALSLAPGWRLRPEQVVGVTHLVASSVPNLSPDAVTVIDGDGNPLSDPNHSDEEATLGDAQGVREQIERGKQRAVQQLLDAALGPGVAVVRVNADVALSHEEHLEETYDPERIATRSFEISEERDPAAGGPAAGVPGAASNLPGGAAIEQSDATGLARREERRNFEVTKTVTRAVHPVGRVSRLTVAVVVDAVWSGEGDARTSTPRTDEEMARIRSLVVTAAGIDESRGDAVSVECVPFAAHREVREEPEPDVIAQYIVYAPDAAIALAVLVVLVIALIVWWRRRRNRKDEPDTLSGERVDVGELPSPAKIAALSAGEKGEEIELSAEDFQDPQKAIADYEQLRQLALEIARRDPELAARVVRGWLADDLAAGAGDAESSEEEAA